MRARDGSIPLLFKEGWLRLNKKVRFLSAQTGWLVKSRVASLYTRAAILILFEITNHPVCAAKERDLLIEAQPPLLEKEGNGAATTGPEPYPNSAPSQNLDKRSGTVYLYRHTLYR